MHKKILFCFDYKPYMEVQIYQNIFVSWLQVLEPIVDLCHLRFYFIYLFIFLDFNFLAFFFSLFLEFALF